MDFSVIITRLNELTTFMNNVISLSKKIFELPPSTAGQKSVAVWNAASNTTEQFDLSGALDAVNAIADGIKELGTITRSGNDFTFSVGFEWRIQGLNYANSSDFIINIPLATTGFFRTDIIVLDDTNSIIRIQGFEASPVSIQPPTPPGTLFLCSIVVYGDTVYNPSDPTLQGQDNFVRVLEIPISSLSGSGTMEEQICEYILSLQETDRTIQETDSKWNVVIVDAITPPAVQVFNSKFNNKFQ